ncbi:MAG TPA: succinyldiaminopimelate transaminase [Burkholderiales bacterium]|nr:succinyldiaminopimelate transaminase [Burkholderiales bacterium]
MNPDLARLQPYPFQKLATLLAGTTPDGAHTPINLSIGEPKHPTPAFIKSALSASLDGLAVYPATRGGQALREALSAWIARRYSIPPPDPHRQVLPVNGSREALFAFAQAVVDATAGTPVVVAPNPFYQIYEGAALLAGAEPQFLNALPDNDFDFDPDQLPETVWRRTQLLYACSPGNPTGRVLSLREWQRLFELSDRHGFVIAADECYSEIYFRAPPLGALEAARRLGRDDYRRLVVFSSLSKRSNVPGLRSGFVAGDAAILEKFLLYRTYHGSAMNPAVQAASVAAWKDEAHVEENRRMYAEKFAHVLPIVREVSPVQAPDAAFYLWLATPIADTEFSRRLYRHYNLTVLPGSFLARDARGVNPGANRVRIALVPSLSECVEAASRLREFIRSLH